MVLDILYGSSKQWMSLEVCDVCTICGITVFARISSVG